MHIALTHVVRNLIASFVFIFVAILPFSVDAATVTINTDITTNATWTSGNVYVVQGQRIITSGVTLTIDSGTVVKFSNSSRLIVEGALDVQGSTSSPVYLTSLEDDSVGGDIDSNPSSGTEGDWKNIQIASGGIFNADHTIIRYGGASNMYENQYTHIYNNGGVVNISNSTSTDVTRNGIYNASGTTTVTFSDLSDAEYNGIFSLAGSLSVSTSTIHDNAVGIYVNGGYLNFNGNTFVDNSGAAVKIFAGDGFTNSGNASTGTGINGIIVGDTTSTNQRWMKDTIPYVISSSGLYVLSGSTLTIDPGVVVKFENEYSSMTIEGNLVAEGDPGDKIYFTSIYDDSIGGDATGNGATTPSTGDWREIKVTTGGSATFENVRMYYGGRSDVYTLRPILKNEGGEINLLYTIIASSTKYGIYNQAGTTTVLNSTLMKNGSHGIFHLGGSTEVSTTTVSQNAGYGLYAQNSGNFIFNNNVINDNVNAAVYIGTTGLTFDHYNNSASNNAINGIYLYGLVDRNQTWVKDNIPYVVEYVGVETGKILTINPGVRVKFNNGNSQLVVDGTLNADAVGTSTLIIFTSIHDDSPQDDTNNDGLTTTLHDYPNAGYWGNITINPGGNANFNYALIKFGGYYSYCCSNLAANIINDGGILNISNSEIFNAKDHGIRQLSGTSTISNTDIALNDYGIYVSGGVVSVVGDSKIHDNNYGVYNTSGNTVDATDVYWGHVSGPNHSTNIGGLGDAVSDNVNFIPWNDDDYFLQLSTQHSVLGNYVSLSINSIYASQLSVATTTWNNEGNIEIVVATSTVSLEIEDVSVEDGEDLFYAGLWSNSTNPHKIRLNMYFMEQVNENMKINIISHELGHSLGLAHSVLGNIMYKYVTQQTATGTQDSISYHEKWP